MNKITIEREKNFLTMFRPYKIYIDNNFVDFIEPDEKVKTLEIDSPVSELRIGVNNCSSNIFKLDGVNNSRNTFRFNVTSQIHNGLFIFIFVTFFGSLILRFFRVIENPYLSIALSLPFAIIVYWQTLGKKSYLRLSKKD